MLTMDVTGATLTLDRRRGDRRRREDTSWWETAATEETRVVIIDHHRVIREGVRAMTDRRAALRVIADTGDVDEGLRLALTWRPRIALVGLSLGDAAALDLVRQLRQLDPEIRCVVLSPVVDDRTFFRAVVAGAAAYVVEDVDGEELVDTLTRVADGETLIDRHTIDQLRRRMTSLPATDDLARVMTAQEQRIIALVADGHTNLEIAQELRLAEKTVRNYMSNILAKAGLRNRTELAAYVARATTTTWG
ncbi:response regulator transcription factor [Nitriliruptoraceae bacterium ZYF776]|nr:response regulator transcription factor [Profundirhabdus halotolerans]